MLCEQVTEWDWNNEEEQESKGRNVNYAFIDQAGRQPKGLRG